MNKYVIYIGGFVVATIAAIMGAMVFQKTNALPQPEHALYYQQARDIKPFTLTDHNGNAFTNAQLKGKWSLVFFGYTSCPDVCPTGLSVIKSALSKLGDKADSINVLFVTLDPERDDHARLKSYLPFFDDRIIGLSGSASELAVVAEQYGVYYKKVNSDDSSLGYSIDHSANFFVIDSTGSLAYVLDHNVGSAVLADVIQNTR